MVIRLWQALMANWINMNRPWMSFPFMTIPNPHGACGGSLSVNSTGPALQSNKLWTMFKLCLFVIMGSRPTLILWKPCVFRNLWAAALKLCSNRVRPHEGASCSRLPTGILRDIGHQTRKKPFGWAQHGMVLIERMPQVRVTDKHIEPKWQDKGELYWGSKISHEQLC